MPSPPPTDQLSRNTTSDVVQLRSASISIALLAAVNLLCYWNSLNGYFYADDFAHLSFLYDTFSKHPEQLWSSLISPWQDRTFQLFYRPLVEISLAIDYLIWEAHPLGYHISNLLLQISSSLCVFGITQRLLRDADRQQAQLAALFSGIIFACYPLHGEVVNWVVGRVDGLCVALYLTSFWLFLRNDQDYKTRSIASLACFAFSLLSKEMAVTLPFVVALYSMIWSAKELSYAQRLISSVKSALPYLAVLAVYALLRTMVLGTVIGGHVSALAQLFQDTLLARLFQTGSFWSLLFPLNSELIPLHGKLSTALHATYLAAALAIVLRLAYSKYPTWLLKPKAFLVGFLLLAPLPALQVWCITSVLTGGRFAYLASVPLCILFTLLIFPFSKQSLPSEKTAESEPTEKYDENGCVANLSIRTAKTDFSISPMVRLASTASIAVLLAIIACFTAITIRNNQAWLLAADETKAICDSIGALAAGKGKHLVVLNLPRDCHGAHMFYTFDFLKILLQPPFQNVDLSRNVGSVDLRCFKDSDLLNLSRLEEMAASGRYAFSYWLRPHRQLQSADKDIELLFKRRNLGGSSYAEAQFVGQKQFELDGCKRQRWLYSLDSRQWAGRFSFVDVTASFQSKPQTPIAAKKVSLGWSAADRELFGRTSAPSWRLYDDGKEHVYRFSVSDRKSWCLNNSSSSLFVDLPEGDCSISSVTLRDGAALLPTLSASKTELELLDDGTYNAVFNHCRLHYDISGLTNAAYAELEVSPPFYSFDEYEGTMHPTVSSKQSIIRMRSSELKGIFEIAGSKLPTAGWYQMRVYGLTKSGVQTGYCSDPVTVRFGP